MPKIRSQSGDRGATLMSARTTIGINAVQEVVSANQVIRAKLTGTGALTATVLIWGSTENLNTAGTGVLLATLNLTAAANLAVAGVSYTAPWPYVWAELTSISGTGAAVTVQIAIGQ